MELFQQLVDEGKLTEDEAKALVEGLESKIAKEKEAVRLATIAESNKHLEAEFEKIQEQIEAKEAEIIALKESQGMSEEDVKTAILQLENQMVNQISLYVKELSLNTISEELVAKVAQFDLYESAFKGIASLVGESVMSLDPIIAEKKAELDSKLTTGLTESKTEIETLKSTIAGIQKDMQATAKTNQRLFVENQSLQKGLYILKESDGLTEEEQTRAVLHFKDKTLAETQQELGEFKKLLESSTVGSLVDNFRKDRDRSKHNQGTGRNIENNLNESSSIEQVNQSGSEAQKPTQPTNTVFSQANNLVD